MQCHNHPLWDHLYHVHCMSLVQELENIWKDNGKVISPMGSNNNFKIKELLCDQHKRGSKKKSGHTGSINKIFMWCFIL